MSSTNHPDFLASLIDAETLYQRAPCGYLSFLQDGTIIRINETLLNWTGYSNEELLEKRFGGLISKGGHMYYTLFYLPLLQLQAQVNEVNFEIKRKDGSTFPALLNAAAVKDEKGQILAINAAVYDITDRKKYEAELLAAKVLADSERTKFEFLADFIPEMIWMASTEGRIDYANKRFLTYFDLTTEKLNAENIYARLHTDDVEKCAAAWNDSVQTGTDLQVQVRVRNTAGAYNWFLIRAVPHKEQGVVTKWLGSFSNIDEHVIELSRRDDFLSIASHELKTPLTSLKGSLQILNQIKDKPNSPLQVKMIEQSYRSMNKINELVDGLLNVRRMKEGYLTLNKTEFGLYQLVEASCRHIGLTGKHQLILTGDQDLTVLADEHQIEQVLVNFVNNAVKYAPNSARIQLTVERLPEMAKISVIDTGPGIDEEKIPFLFDRYYRADHGGKDYTGLGLGLYICSEIVKRHGGLIGVDSKRGKGSTFWFTLPM